MMPRRSDPLVRQKPFLDRLLASLNPWDFLLWLSEEIETRELGSASVGNNLGLALNVLFLFASANSRQSAHADDVFSDHAGAGWVAYTATAIVWILGAFSIWNLGFALLRTRSYRLFEANVEKKLDTPSAQRVRVQSQPGADSPMRQLLTGMRDAIETRAHPDKTRDVWELNQWDPLPASLQMVCLFSPLHVLTYLLSFPLAPLAPRPSVIVFTCILQQVTWSALLLVLRRLYAQQNQDAATIQKWVMREYDTKYVHPRLHPVVRDASTQCNLLGEGQGADYAAFGTPTTVISRGFQTHPNQNYAKHFDPYNLRGAVTRSTPEAVVFTPTSQARPFEGLTSMNKGRQSLGQGIFPASAIKQQIGRSTSRASLGANFGGSLGVYTHSESPLRKATSFNNIRESSEMSSPIRNSRDMAAMEQQELAENMVRRHSPISEASSPFKGRSSLYGRTAPSEAGSPHPFARMGQHSSDERFPKRWS